MRLLLWISVCRRAMRLVATALVVALTVCVVVEFRTARALVRHWREPAALTIPVTGVLAEALVSTFGAPRSGHRRHRGIDIFAHRNTPVVAAAAGEVVFVGENSLGGHVIDVVGEGAALYYYAHLDHFRDGIAPGDRVVQGEILGYVGTSGNAAGTPPHLHFGIYPLRHAFRAVDPAAAFVVRHPAGSRLWSPTVRVR